MQSDMPAVSDVTGSAVLEVAECSMVMSNGAVHCSRTGTARHRLGQAAEPSCGWTPCSVLAHCLHARDHHAAAVGRTPVSHQVLHMMMHLTLGCRTPFSTTSTCPPTSSWQTSTTSVPPRTSSTRKTCSHWTSWCSFASLKIFWSCRETLPGLATSMAALCSPWKTQRSIR